MMPMMLAMLTLTVIAFVFAVQGVNMHNQVAVEEAEFHAQQAEYFNNSRSQSAMELLRVQS